MAKIKGLNKLLKDIKKFGKEAEKRIDEDMASVSSEIVVMAKQKAPKDTGKLTQSIGFEDNNDLSYTIFAGVKYAPYIEYGTGGFVEIPKELKDNAIQFKGKGIKKINLPARPFLYPSVIKGREQLIKDLENTLDDLTNNI